MKRLRNGKIKREDLAIQFVLQGQGREGEGRTMKVFCKELAKGRLKKKKAIYSFQRTGQRTLEAKNNVVQ